MWAQVALHRYDTKKKSEALLLSKDVPSYPSVCFSRKRVSRGLGLAITPLPGGGGGSGKGGREISGKIRRFCPRGQGGVGLARLRLRHRTGERNGAEYSVMYMVYSTGIQYI